MIANITDEVREAIAAIVIGGKEAQGAAYQFLMRQTQQPVPWVYEVWDELVAALSHKDNRTRAIAGQLLCNLAKSDTDARMERDLDKIYAVTFDEKFVTARHVLLALWKVGVGDVSVRAALVERLVGRFKTCLDEKNWTLVRYDLLCTLRTLYDHTGDDAVKSASLALIELEADAKYKKKYATVWRAI